MGTLSLIVQNSEHLLYDVVATASGPRRTPTCQIKTAVSDLDTTKRGLQKIALEKKGGSDGSFKNPCCIIFYHRLIHL